MNADVAVIGAGVVGAAVARNLAAAGVSAVIVDDADPAAATAAGAGLVCPALADDVPQAVAGLLRVTGEMLPGLLTTLSGSPGGAGAARRGLVVLGERRAMEELATAVLARRDAGVPFVERVEVLDGAGVRALVPLADRAEAGLHVAGAVQVSGQRFAMAQIEDAGSNVTVVRTTATAVTENAGGCRIETAAGEIRADRVVIASGVRTQLLRELRDGWLMPSRGQQLVVDVPEQDWPATAPAVMTGRHYAFSDGPGLLRVGATHEHGESVAQVSIGGVAELTRALLDISSRATGFHLRRTVVGIRAVSGDGIPVIGALPGRDRLFVASGMGAYGLMAGTAAARLAADLVLGTATALDPAPFSPERWRR